MPRVKLILVCLLAIVAIIVLLQNTGPVETKLLFVSVTMPRALLLLLTLAVGFVLGVIVSIPLTKKKGPPHE